MNEKKQQSAKVDDVKKLAGIELPDYTTDENFKLEVGVTYEGSFIELQMAGVYTSGLTRREPNQVT